MKKGLLALWLFMSVTQVSFAQILKKKAVTTAPVTNPNIKKMDEQRNKTQGQNIPVIKPVKVPNLKTITRNPVFINLYTKKIIFADGTKMNIGILNPALQRKPNLDFFSNNQSVQSTISAYYVGGTDKL